MLALAPAMSVELFPLDPTLPDPTCYWMAAMMLWTLWPSFTQDLPDQASGSDV